MVVRENHNQEMMKPCLPAAGNFSIWAIALAIGLFSGCGKKKAATNAKDFSRTNSVTILLGDLATEYGTGLQHAYFEEDGATEPAILDGVACRHLYLAGTNCGYFYFSLDPTFKKRLPKRMTIEVEFLDPIPGMLGLQFDASSAKHKTRGAYSDVNPIHLSGSKGWQTAKFRVRDATFRNAQNSGSDFRLCITPPRLYVRRVTVIKEAD